MMDREKTSESKSKKEKARFVLQFREFDDPLQYFTDAEQLGKTIVEIFSAIGSNPTGFTHTLQLLPSCVLISD